MPQPPGPGPGKPKRSIKISLRDERKRKFRLQIMVDEAELKRIDEWRYEERVPTRSEAFRELLKLGLATEGDEPPPHH